MNQYGPLDLLHVATTSATHLTHDLHHTPKADR